MHTIKIIAYQRDLSNADLAIYTQSVITATTAQAVFSSVSNIVSLLQTANATLNTALLAQKPGNKASTSALHAAATDVKRLLKLLAANIEFISHNIENVALSSGFTIKKPNTRDAKTFKAKQGKTSGTVDLEINSYGKAAYQWEMSPDPIGIWSPLEVTVTSKTMVSNLVPGTKYWFRVAVITSKGKKDYADPHLVHVV